MKVQGWSIYKEGDVGTVRGGFRGALEPAEVLRHAGGDRSEW